MEDTLYWMISAVAGKNPAEAMETFATRMGAHRASIYIDEGELTHYIGRQFTNHGPAPLGSSIGAPIPAIARAAFDLGHVVIAVPDNEGGKYHVFNMVPGDSSRQVFRSSHYLSFYECAAPLLMTNNGGPDRKLGALFLEGRPDKVLQSKFAGNSTIGQVSRAVASAARLIATKVNERFDSLTGLPRRPELEEQMRSVTDIFLNVKRGTFGNSDFDFAFAIVDLDRFKVYNDSYGHHVGDEVLVACSNALRSGMRTGLGEYLLSAPDVISPYGVELFDLVGRWGGEEFAIVIPGANPENAFKIAERLRTAVNSIKITLGDGIILQPSCSIGLANASSLNVGNMNSKGLSDTLFRIADLAVYRAKEEGRNRTIVAVFEGENLQFKSTH